MKRRIVDYEKLTTEVLNYLIDKYPNGYGYNDIMSFQNNAGETIKALEIRTEDTIYLVKISNKLEQKISDYIDELDIDNKDEDLFTDVTE